MKKIILEELDKINFFFDYQRGVVISEQKHTIKENFDFNKYPCINPEWDKKKASTGYKQGPTTMGIEYVYGKGNDSINYKLGNQTFYLKDISFSEDGTWWQGGYERGKFSCGTKGEILFDGIAMTKAVTKPNTSGTDTPNKTYSIPELLKQNVGNKTGVQSFQDWLDTNHSGWIKKYGKLESKPERGYGKFGPNTKRAWDMYKDKYYSGAPLKVTNPGITDADKPVDDSSVVTTNATIAKADEQGKESEDSKEF